MILEWYRYSTFIEAREVFRGEPCIYIQTDQDENILRIGQTGDPYERYKGGTAYAIAAAGHGSRNLYFFSCAPTELQKREALEATLIFELQPMYNNQHKQNPPKHVVDYTHSGDVPKCLRSTHVGKEGKR